MDRIATIVATVRIPARGTEQATDAATERLRIALCSLLAEHGAELVGCDWAPDADTIGDCVDNPDGSDLPVHVSIIDLNPARGGNDCANCGIDLAAHDDAERATCEREHADALAGRA